MYTLGQACEIHITMMPVLGYVAAMCVIAVYVAMHGLGYGAGSAFVESYRPGYGSGQEFEPKVNNMGTWSNI